MPIPPFPVSDRALQHYLATTAPYSVAPLDHDRLEKLMTRFARTLLLLSLVAVPLSRVRAQQTNEQLAERCAELGAIFDRYGARRSEGSGGPNMIRLGAGIDCQRGRYAQGIKALEDLLQRNKIGYPPG
jgi:hypothetical protein